MRVAPNLYTAVNAAIGQSEEQLQGAVSQLASGKKVAIPSDDALAFANDLRSVAASASVDRYTQNAQAVTAQAQMADAALSGVVTLLTKAVSLGTEAGNGTLTDSQRSALAQQLQGILASVVSQANSTSNGAGLFAGTAGTATPFVADPSSAAGYTYQGNSETNHAQVGDALSVTVGVPGDTIFMSASGNVLGSLQQLVSAVQSGSSSAIADSTAAVTSAIAHVDEVRATYGGTVSQLNAQSDYLSSETVALTSQQTSLTAVDTATAATNLTQAQTAHDAMLAMAAKILPTSLLNYLQN